MNRLSSIYTKTGDDGTTGLAHGERVDKFSIHVHAMGDIDELNSIIGILVAANTDQDIAQHLLELQQHLFDIGGEIAMPDRPVINEACVTWIEELIDSYNANLPALKEFILPGGLMAAAICHLARSICRRAERHLVQLSEETNVNAATLRYINRLSDLLFVFARALNQKEAAKEVFWNSRRLKRESKN